MGAYIYQAKKGPHQLLKGEIEAATRQEALTKLDSLGLFPITVEEKSTSARKSYKVPLKELVEFTHQLSTLINSGSTLLVSLNTLVSETEHGALRPVFLDIIARVKEGEDFSQALNRYPYIFPQLYTSLARVGETSGTLGSNLKRISEFMEEELDFRTNIVSIATYPLLVCGVGVATVLVLLKFVVPKLVSIFEELGQTLPLSTTLLIRASHFFSKYWVVIIGIIVACFFAAKKSLKNHAAKLKWDAFTLRMPLLGDLLKKIEVCRLARTLSLLLQNGVPLVSSLNVLASTIPNIFFQKEIGVIEEKITEGSSLHDAMRGVSVFSPTFINVVTVGENAGTLDDVLENLSNEYNKEINRKIKRLLNFLEPLLIFGVGLIVGFIVLSILLPIFQIDFNL